MAELRKHHSAEMKANVALEAIKGRRTIADIALEYGVHPSQVAQWKKQVLDELPIVFAHPRSGAEKNEKKLIASLYQQIGQLKVEVDLLKRSTSITKQK